MLDYAFLSKNKEAAITKPNCNSFAHLWSDLCLTVSLATVRSRRSPRQQPIIALSLRQRVRDCGSVSGLRPLVVIAVCRAGARE